MVTVITTVIIYTDCQYTVLYDKQYTIHMHIDMYWMRNTCTQMTLYSQVLCESTHIHTSVYLTVQLWTT